MPVYKVGDRVKFHGTGYYLEDTGTIIRPSVCGSSQGWWVRLDNDGKELWFDANSEYLSLINDKTNKHVHSELIKAWADGAEIEVLMCNEWTSISVPWWFPDREYSIKQEPKIVKMYMQYDNITKAVNSGEFDMEPDQRMFSSNVNMSSHLEFTFVDGKLQSVEMKEPT